MVMHASSSDNTSYPLCRAPKFRYVTMSIQDVTCEACILIIDRKGNFGAQMAGTGSEARQIAAEVKS
jgi:hypothetical protein